MTPRQTFHDLADAFDRRRPSAVQLKVGNPDFNAGVVAGLEWAAAEARRRGDEILTDYDADVERLAALSFEDLEKEFPTLWSPEGYWAWLVYEVMKRKLGKDTK